MSIQSTEIKKYLSGGAANSDTNASLGGAISSVEIVDNTINNLFATAGAAEALTGSTKYRAFFIKNTHATLTAINSVIYISSNTPSTDTSVEIAIADEATGVSTIETIANENTAPSGPTFSVANGVINAITIGDIAPGAMKGIWVKWIIGASTVAVNDTMTITARVETEA